MACGGAEIGGILGGINIFRPLIANHLPEILAGHARPLKAGGVVFLRVHEGDLRADHKFRIAAKIIEVIPVHHRIGRAQHGQRVGHVPDGIGVLLGGVAQNVGQLFIFHQVLGKVVRRRHRVLHLIAGGGKQPVVIDQQVAPKQARSDGEHNAAHDDGNEQQQ